MPVWPCGQLHRAGSRIAFVRPAAKPIARRGTTSNSAAWSVSDTRRCVRTGMRSLRRIATTFQVARHDAGSVSICEMPPIARGNAHSRKRAPDDTKRDTAARWLDRWNLARDESRRAHMGGGAVSSGHRTALTRSNNIAKPQATSIASSRGRRQPTCRCNRQPGTNSRSI